MRATVASTFNAIVLLQPDNRIEATGTEKLLPPALLIKMSSPPSVDTVSVTSRSAAPSSVTSAAIAMARPPDFSIASRRRMAAPQAMAFEELVARRAGRSPAVEEVGHRPDRIPQRCERAARAGIHVGSEHPPDLRHSRSSRLVDHGSQIVFDDLHPTGARSGKNRTPDPAIDRGVDLLDQLLCERSQPRLVVGQRWLRMGLHPVRLEGPDVAGHPGPTATVT